MGKVTRGNVEFLGRKGSAEVPPFDAGEATLAKQLDMFWIFADPDDVSLGKHLIYDGFWESWITAWVINNVTDGMNCVDIGANQGYFTFLFATLSPTGKIYAFEPMPRYVDMLEDTAHTFEYKNVIICDYAISNSFGEATLMTPGNYFGSSTIEIDSMAGKYGPEKNIVCRKAPLDGILLPPVQFVKIDAEGSERDIWYGMQALIEKTPDILILMEFDQRRYGDDQSFIRDVFEKMDVTVVNFDGDEQPTNPEQLAWYKDLVMLVLRRKK